MIRRLGTDDDFHVSVEQGDEVQQPLRGEALEFVVAQFGNMGLRNAEDFGDCGLRQFAFLDQVVETLNKSFDRLRTNGELLIPFVVRLSNHERNQLVQRFLGYMRQAGDFVDSRL